MERDGALLHPAGPEEEEEDDNDEEEEDDAVATDEEAEKEESLDTEEYKNAMLELEGLKVSDTHPDGRDEDDEGEKEEEKETETTPAAGSDDEKAKDLEEEELNEAEDECPELADLSASNKEFKPFR